MHRPGYVQGGQEANRGYLLLGVHHRRIHSFTIPFKDVDGPVEKAEGGKVYTFLEYLHVSMLTFYRKDGLAWKAERGNKYIFL
jgi:hypothetical protein